MDVNILFINFENKYIISRDKYASRVMHDFIKGQVYFNFKHLEDNFKFNLSYLYKFNLKFNVHAEGDIEVKTFMDSSLEREEIKYHYDSLDTKLKKSSFLNFINFRKKQQEEDLTNLQKFLASEDVNYPIYFIFRNPINHFKSGLIQEFYTIPTIYDVNDKFGINFKSIIKTFNPNLTDGYIDEFYNTFKIDNKISNNEMDLYKNSQSNLMKSLILNKMILYLKYYGYNYGHMGNYLSLIMPFIFNNKNINFINLDGEYLFNFEKFFKDNFNFSKDLNVRLGNFSNKDKYQIVDDLLFENSYLRDKINEIYSSDIIWYNILNNDNRKIESR